MMAFLRGIVWFALVAVLLGIAAVVTAIWWPEKMVLVFALGLSGVIVAILSLREER